MACMEHLCRLCQHYWMDNKTPGVCPKCGGKDVSNWFDEPMEG